MSPFVDLNLQRLSEDLSGTRLSGCLPTMAKQLHTNVHGTSHGKLPLWLSEIATLPDIPTSSVDFTSDQIRIGSIDDCPETTRQQLREILKKFMPWRKGPYTFFGLPIDTEWRSDWKWRRIVPYLAPLQDRLVLDVGCGNGYHLWRMLGDGARLVLGIDPSLLFMMQFQILKHYAISVPVHYLPLKSEDLPDLQGKGFDTVFSMGVLYHRHSPLDHLLELKRALRDGGELVVESLVVEGDATTVLVPDDRYAMMRNVWFIPSALLLEHWLKRLGFVHIRTIDVTPTSLKEQRQTEWMQFESLADFLDPEDPSRTVEGHPAPVRAVVMANLP